MNISIVYNNKIINNSLVSPEFTKKTPVVKWSTLNNAFYTLIMYDTSAPYPSPNNNFSPLVHWVVTNIPQEKLYYGNTILNYLGPSPPADSSPHEYVVSVYKQGYSVNPPPITNRKNFPLSQFTRQYNLTFVGKGKFYAGYQQEIPRQVPQQQTTPREGYFISGNPLSAGQQAYCKCTLDLDEKNPRWCNKEKAYFETRENQTCYNPYAVCTKSVGQQSECSQWFNFDAFSDAELTGYSDIRRIQVPEPYNRKILLQNIAKYVCKGQGYPKNPIC